jgi:hypothetical protein
MVQSKASEDAGRNEVASAVLSYLQRHPNAADTLDGIVSWWLPQQRYETERQHIKRTLGEMVERGELRRDRLPDGAVLYALNHPGGKSPG